MIIVDRVMYSGIVVDMKGRKAGRPKAIKPLDRMLSVRIEAQIRGQTWNYRSTVRHVLAGDSSPAIMEFVNKNIAAQSLTIRAGSSVEDEVKDIGPQGK